MTESNDNAKYIIDPSGKKKVILAIDGGGMRGAIVLAMLAELEEKSGKSSQEMFDMFVGTSTGAIISAGLAAGYTAKQLQNDKNLYRGLLRDAFNAHQPQFWWIQGAFSIAFIQFGQLGNGVMAILIEVLLIVFRLLAFLILTVAFLILFLYNLVKKDPMINFVGRIMSHGLRYAYPIQPFLDRLQPLIEARGVKKMSDIKDKILLTTTKNLQTGETAFIVNKGAGAARFKDWLITDAVAGSGSAPIFFDAHKGRFFDGGVSPFGNPCFIAAVEAMEYISASEGFTKGNVILVSIGTGYPPDEINNRNDVTKKIFFDWMQYVISQGLDDAVNQQVYVTRKIYGVTGPKDIDFRRYNISLIKKEIEKLGVPIPPNVDPEKLGLDSSRAEEVDYMAAIGRAYANQIDWSQSDTLPWDFTGGQPDPEDLRTNNPDW